jgi:hypothetical protein
MMRSYPSLPTSRLSMRRWRLQRETLPGATVVLDWWHAAMRFEQPAHGLGAVDTPLADEVVRGPQRAK